AFVVDSLHVLTFAIAWVFGLVATAHVTHQSAITLTLLGFLLPFLLWGHLMGLVIYLHHTHPRLVWYCDIDQWEAARATSCGTVHVQIPFKLGRVLNNIMEHPAHHFDARIPLYRIEEANRALTAATFIVERLSIRSIAACVARCKLFDFDAGRWTDFEGRPLAQFDEPRAAASS